MIYFIELKNLDFIMEKIKQLFWTLLVYTANVRMAQFYMFTLAVAVFIGVVVPQKSAGEMPAFDEIQKLSDKILFILGFYDVFHAWWFYLFIAAFSLSIISVTFVRIIPSLRFKLSPNGRALSLEGMHNVQYQATINNATIEQAKQVLKKHKYGNFEEFSDLEPGIITTDKGRYTKWAALGTHIGMMIIMLGALIGFLGFRDSVDVMPGDSFQVPPPKGEVVKNMDFAVHLKDFWIDHRPDGSVRQFNSILEVTDKQGNKVLDKHIWVNEPLKYHGVYFYQSTYGLQGVTIKIDGKPANMLFQPIPSGSLLTQIFKVGNGQYYLYTQGNNKPIFLLEAIENETGAIKDVKPWGSFTFQGDTFTVGGGHQIMIDDLIYFSGIDVKYDPGIPVIWAGCIIISIMIMIAFMPHQQIYFIQQGNNLFIAGRTNKGKYHFDKEFNTIVEELTNLSKTS